MGVGEAVPLSAAMAFTSLRTPASFSAGAQDVPAQHVPQVNRFGIIVHTLNAK